jgi:NifU-like protein involved in Fe-S cluster formation
MHAMNAPLYNKDILRLAASIPHHGRLANADASVEKRSATCGSRVTADVRMKNGKLVDLGLDVKACALGQASASLMAAQAVLAPARDYPARHASIRLGFEAVAEAAHMADA